MRPYHPAKLVYLSLAALAISGFSFYILHTTNILSLALAFFGFLIAGMAIQANLRKRFAPGLFIAVFAILISMGSIFSNPQLQGANTAMAKPPAAPAS